jgi:toxin FitB
VTYLLDTNILSETRQRQPASGVTSWSAATSPERLHVSALTLGQIKQGIARIRGRGHNEQAAGLERWRRDVELRFADRGSCLSRCQSPLPGGASSTRSRFPSLTG